MRNSNTTGKVKIDLTGQRFNYLTVINYAGQRKGRTYWRCRCECGNVIDVYSYSLKSGNTKACGCHKKDGWNNGRTHGLSKTRQYRIWRNMKNRCENPNDKYYVNYGGRNISICSEWRESFKSFYDWAMENGYSDELTLDRIDNNGNYEPSNCRWVSRTQQMNNTRKNHFIELNGEKHTIAEWCRKLNISYNVLSSRIFTYGWSDEKALTTPVKERG